MRRVNYIKFLRVLVILWLIPLSLSAYRHQSTLEGVDKQYHQRFVEGWKFIYSPRLISYADAMKCDAHQLGLKKEVCMAVLLKDEHYYYTNNLKGMQQTMREMHQYANDEDTYYYYFVTWTRIIRYYISVRKYALALREIERLSKEAIKLNSMDGIAYGYMLQGDLLYQQGRNEAALSRYKKELDFRIKKLKKQEGEGWFGIASCYYELDRLDEAMDGFHKCLSLSATIETQMNATIYYHFCAVMKNDTQLADSLRAEMIEMRHKFVMSPKVAANYYMMQAYDSYFSGDRQQAVLYSDSIPDALYKLVVKAYFYKESGKYAEALQCTERIAELKDSLTDSETVDELTQSQLALDNQLLESQNEQLDIQKKNAELKGNRLFMLVIVVLLVAVAFISVLFAVMRKKKMDWLKRERDNALQMTVVAESARKKAEEADNLKKIFLENVSHEIRTPLNAIVGFSQVIFQEDYVIEPAERKEIIGLIESNSRTLSTLVDEIITMSRYQSGNYQLTLLEMNVHDLCVELLDSVRGMQKKGVELRIDDANDAAHTLTLVTDIQLVQQALTNLLSNGLKFTAEGSVVLSYRKENNQLLFAVTDTGCGIPDEKSEVIFESFEKADRYTQGFGLGLSICKLIAELLGGKISLDRTYKSGSRFIFAVPCNEKIN